MKTLKHFLIALAGLFIIVSCQKEFSFESGLAGKVAVGTLKDSLGSCQLITIKGTYKVDSTLTDSNYVLVQVNVTAPGKYKIVTDTLNGYSFVDSGTITTIGLVTFKLKGSGKPILPITSDFTLAFNNSFCLFSITVTGSILPPVVPVGDYFPTTTNSNWTYELDLFGDTVRYTAKATNSTIMGNTYRNFIADSGGFSDSLFYRKGSGLYYEYGYIDYLGVLDTVYNKIDFIFLKDNVPVANTWESGEVTAEYNSVVGKAKVVLTITAKDITKTINGVTVDSVIVVQREILFKPNGLTTFSTVDKIFMNYAKSRGLLLAEGIFSPPLPALTYKFFAKRYQVF